MTGIARALLEVLLTSVWEGAYIALVACALLRAIGHRASAATRCAVLQSTLAAIVLAPICSTLAHGMHGHITVGFGGAAGATGNGRVAEHSGLFDLHGVDIALGDGTVLALAALWLACVALYALRMVAGYLQLRKIVRRSERLADRGEVRIYRSTELHVPLAFGFRSPSIVLPSALSARSTIEVESIVFHELAHVRRGDAWANAFERAVLAVLFFNPAVIAVRRAIAFERESACDDRAVAESGDVDSYTYALAAFAVSSHDARSLAACGASGFTHATVGRIKRLEDARRNGAISLSRFALGGTIIVLFAVALVLQTYAPAVAFDSQTPARSTIASNACAIEHSRYLSGPPPMDPAAGPGLRGIARVILEASGKVVSAKILKSSGDVAFDRALLRSAMQGTYSAATHDCAPSGGSYIFMAQTGPK